MKILFLCGSITPGSDGVGDYTRRLAGASIKKGSDAAILALYDKDSKAIEIENQVSDGITLSVTRIPQALPDHERYSYVKEYIAQYDPAWISLQFVIFSFHKKGLPVSLASNFKPLLQGRNVHVMFHEVWVGIEQDASFKHKVLGYLQKNIVRHFLKTVRPDCITTHTPLYAWELERIGFKAEILPLFGNVPISAALKNQSQDPNILRAVMFGNIHHGAPAEQFVQDFAQAAKAMNKKAELVFIGKCGNELQAWMHACAQHEIEALNKGILSEEELSEQMTQASFGITTTPFLLTSKSGTAAAMQEHGLAVICVARGWEVKGFHEKNSAPEGIRLYEDTTLQAFLLDPSAAHNIKFGNIVDHFFNLLNL